MEIEIFNTKPLNPDKGKLNWLAINFKEIRRKRVKGAPVVLTGYISEDREYLIHHRVCEFKIRFDYNKEYKVLEKFLENVLEYPEFRFRPKECDWVGYMGILLIPEHRLLPDWVESLLSEILAEYLSRIIK